jgi:hypothetical protein
MSSVGGDVLYVYTNCDMTGPKVDCRAWGAKEAEEEGGEEVEADTEGVARNYTTVSA